MANQDISLTTYDPNFAAIQRQQRLAELLSQQASAPIEINSGGGVQAPISPFAVLAKGLQGYAGSYLDRKAQDKAQGLQKGYRSEFADALKNFYQAPGSPAMPAAPAMQTSINASAPSIPGAEAPVQNNVSATIPAQAATAATGPHPTSASDQMQMAAKMLGSGNPFIQQTAPTLYENALKREQAQLTPMSGQETEALGFRPGTVAFRDFNGNPVVKQASDVKSDAAVKQAISEHQGEQILTPEALAQKVALEKIQQGPAWANVDIARQKLAAVKAGAIDPDSVGFMADQVLAGDKSPFQNLGRGAQGAENIATLRREVMTRAKARNLGGADLAALNAEFAGLQAGERTLGTRTANVEMAASETQQLAPLALAASAAVNRSQYPSLNKIQLAVQQGTGDENVIRLNQSVNALVNTYSRAISPSGTPTVSDKEHAREILESAYSKGQFAAAIDQMQKEIGAARRSPGSVRGEFRGAISGRTPGVAAVPDAPNSAAPAKKPTVSNW